MTENHDANVGEGEGLEEGAAAPEGAAQTAAVELDPHRLAALHARLAAEQNLPLAIFGGFAAAVVGAGIWAGVTVATEYQIGLMAVAVGFMVGFAVRKFGKGVSVPYGVVGAVLALFGCVLGNLLSACAFVALQEQLPFFDVTLSVLAQPAVAMELLGVMFSPMDLLFYGLAVYGGYQAAFRQVTEEELGGLVVAT